MTIWIWLFFWKFIEYDYLQYDYYFRKSKIWLFAIWLFFEKNEEIWLFAIRVIFLVSTIIGLFTISGLKHRFPVLFFPAFYWQGSLNLKGILHCSTFSRVYYFIGRKFIFSSFTKEPFFTGRKSRDFTQLQVSELTLLKILTKLGLLKKENFSFNWIKKSPH